MKTNRFAPKVDSRDNQTKMAQTLGVSLAKYVYWESSPEQMPCLQPSVRGSHELPLDVIFGPNSLVEKQRENGRQGDSKKWGKCLLWEPIVITDRRRVWTQRQAKG